MNFTNDTFVAMRHLGSGPKCLHLDLRCCVREARNPMKPPLLSATAVALLALTACQSKTTTTAVENSTSVENKTVAEKPKFELPPAIKAEVSMRCHGDNSLAHVTFFEGEKQLTVSSPADAAPVVLKAPESGKPYVGDGGWEVSGTAKSIKLTAPGKDAQTCDA